jgi:phytanoyl-CoA hydroxylase
MLALDNTQVEEYQQDGFTIARGLIDPEAVIDPVLQEYQQVLDALAHRLYAEGHLASAYTDLPFDARLCRVYSETGQVFSQHFDCQLPQAGTREDSPICVGPAVFAALRHQRLLDGIEDLMGGEIYSNPVQHVRLKPPERYLEGRMDERTGRVAGFDVGATPWHQDNGVVLPVADQTEMMTVWVPLTRATAQNGCLEVIRGSHRQGLLHHCSSPFGLFVQDRHLDLDRVVTATMERGDVLFMHRRTCHSSLPNKSDGLRISFDLRYNPVGQPTGRDVFPGFIARSRANPTNELRDPEAWAASWFEARQRLSRHNVAAYHRWPSSDPVCA